MPLSQQNGSCLRVLVVDDYADVAESMAMLLRFQGHEVETARSGRQALDLAKVLQPQAVICDLSMPGMSGFEVAKRLRRLCAGKLLLIAVSGNAVEEARQQSLSAGFDHHLVKPADPVRILQLLRDFADGKPSWNGTRPFALEKLATSAMGDSLMGK